MKEVLGPRRFTLSDGLWFAAASGDHNPLHVDPLAARRSPIGGVVIHGVHALLWCLERHLASGGEDSAGVSASFLHPVLPGEELSLERDREEGRWSLSLRAGGDALLYVSLKPGAPVGRDAAPQGGPIAPVPPRDRPFAELRGDAGAVALRLDSAGLASSFPTAASKLGGLRLAALAGVSRLVGMECPGRHSLLSRLDLSFDGPSGAELSYRVTRHLSPRAPLGISVSGGGLSGTVGAFFLPPPTEQVRAAEAGTRVAPGEFAGQHALIVGGSRGLGELTAQLLAAGGAKTVITYHHGEKDALRIAEDITAAGGSCRALALDLTEPGGVAAFLRRLDPRPTHLYYFATPHIAKSRPGPFDPEVLGRFRRIYVEAFSELCLALVRRGPLAVFYPSTVFIDAPPKDLAEYAAAKADGEAVCRDLGRGHPGLDFHIERLPRLRTDQNLGFLVQPPADPLPLMLAAARAMDGRPKEGSTHA